MTAKVYVENKESRRDLWRCPTCGSEDCTVEDRDYSGTEYVEYYRCNVCEQEFAEVYEYKQTEYTKELRR